MMNSAEMSSQTKNFLKNTISVELVTWALHSDKVQKLINELQKDSKIPLLVAANCDAGGNGAVNDGTYVAVSCYV